MPTPDPSCAEDWRPAGMQLACRGPARGDLARHGRRCTGSAMTPASPRCRGSPRRPPAEHAVTAVTAVTACHRGIRPAVRHPVLGRISAYRSTRRISADPQQCTARPKGSPPATDAPG